MYLAHPTAVLKAGVKRGAWALGVMILSGCASLPSSGPTGSQIMKTGSHDPATDTPFQIVEVNGLGSIPSAPSVPPSLLVDRAVQPTDLIGPNDLLEISIFETGISLFSGASPASLRANMDPSTQVEKLPVSRVDDSGYIQLPFAGRIQAAGLTTAQLAATIRRALQGMSQNPQVVVTMRETINNSVLVGGDVGRPGRLALATNRETLLDAITLAGGYKGDAKDYGIRVERDGLSAELRLSDILSGSGRDVRVFPGDKISVVRQPLSFSVMGAPGKVEQIPFARSRVSLAEALAQSGGANPNIGDPKAIFVLRYVRNGGGQEVPTVYHFNMMRTQTYFLAQRFAMENNDILYVANASANQPSKFIQIISQLFAPIATVDNVLR